MSTPLRKANQQTMAVSNRRTVLELLRRHGALSQAQLAELTGLQNSTLSYITRQLVADGLLMDGGRRSTGRVGKKQRLLQLNPEHGWAAGLELTRDHVELIAVDATGAVRAQTRLTWDGDLVDLAQLLAERWRPLLATWNLPAARLLGAGVGVSGIVDAPRGKLLRSTMFDVHNLDLADMLSSALGTPVLLDHNANLAAVAELRLGAAREHSHFVQVVMNPTLADRVLRMQSFGAAVVLDGKLYRGVHSAAGELDSGVAPLGVPDGELDDLTRLAHADAALSPMLQRTAESLGESVAHLVNLLDPSVVVLSASQPLENSAFLRVVNEHLSRRLIPVAERCTRAVLSHLSPRGVGLGGAIAAIEANLFDQPLNQVLSMDVASETV